jgi:hypothetical protein
MRARTAEGGEETELRPKLTARADIVDGQRAPAASLLASANAAHAPSIRMGWDEAARPINRVAASQCSMPAVSQQHQWQPGSGTDFRRRRYETTGERYTRYRRRFTSGFLQL